MESFNAVVLVYTFVLTLFQARKLVKNDKETE